MKTTVNARAKRAADSSPGWSEAEPGVTALIEIQARFSGRQIRSGQNFCRPLKRARTLLSLMYPGLRCACPGLNSSAGYAGSLNGFAFHSAFQTSVQTSLGLIPEGGFDR